MASNRKMDVKAIVSIDGELVNYVSLKISQEMCDHHDFELVLDHKTFDQLFFDSPEKKLTLAHSKVICDLQHGTDEGNAYTFVGLVTNVRMIAEDGMHGSVLLVGKSTTIELERGEMMQSFSNTNLRLILQEITKGTLNLTKVINPAWTFDIDFAIQMGETDFAFMARILNQFKERWYFSGLDLLVGPHPEFEVVHLTYDKELRSLEVGSRLIPNQFSHYYYKREDHVTFRQDSPAQIEGATQYLQQISQRSDRLSMGGRKPNVPTPAVVPDMAGLIEATKRQKISTGAEMFYIRGECKTCDVRIGRLVQVDLPKNMGASGIGLYRVYKCVHHLDSVGRYVCYFEAIPADLEYLPVPKTPVPMVYPIEAQVYDNEDPLGLGRIRPFFPFDPRPSDAWLAVSSLDAGGNGKGLGPANRGFSFVPEVGDSVLVNFLHPQTLSQPYVSGSMFHGANAVNLGGGAKGNNIKTILTRSSHLIKFDDTKGGESITIIDKNQNLIFIDTANNNMTITANNNMTLNATETMTLNAKNLRINVTEDMASDIGQNQETYIGKDRTVDCLNNKEIIQQRSTIEAGLDIEQTSATLKVLTKQGDMIMKGAGNTLVQGRLDARVSKG